MDNGLEKPLNNNGEEKMDEEALAKKIIELMPKTNIEKTTPSKVLTKMMVEGRADKLLNVLSTLFSAYIEKDAYGNVSSTKTKTLVMTLMLAEKDNGIK